MRGKRIRGNKGVEWLWEMGIVEERSVMSCWEKLG